MDISKKKSIYITCLHLKHGGVERAIVLLANAFVAEGYPVCLLCTYNFGEIAYELDEKVEVQYLTEVLPNKEEFYEALKKKNLFKIISQGIKALKILRLKKKVLKRKFREITAGVIISTRHEDTILLDKYGVSQVLKIAQLHHDHCFDKHLIKDFRYHYRNINYFVLLTEQLKNEVETFMKGYNTSCKCLCIPNFVDELYLEKLMPANEKKQRKKQAVAIGRFHQVKGFERLIQIWAKFSKKNSDWKLMLIGDGELAADLKNQVRIEGVSDSVEFMGFLAHKKIMEILAESAVYLMTSYSEALPFVLIEALSQGVPIIAYDVRIGPGAIIQDGYNGFLIQEDNEKEFLAVLQKISDMTIEEQKNMAYNCYQTAELYAKQLNLQKWLEIVK